MEVVSCRISKYWSVQMERGSHNERMKVYSYINNLKNVKTKNNQILDEILVRLPYVVYEDPKTYPMFHVNGKWFCVGVLSDTRVPSRHLLLLQSSITPPDPVSRRLGSRKIEIVFKEPFQTR